MQIYIQRDRERETETETETERDFGLNVTMADINHRYVFYKHFSFFSED